jgi:hypothetical protein
LGRARVIQTPPLTISPRHHTHVRSEYLYSYESGIQETRRERRRGWLKERGDEKREKAGVVKRERRREERDGGMRGEIGRGVRRGEEEGFREREREREREMGDTGERREKMHRGESK